MVLRMVRVLSERIKVIHKENGGVSSARNVGFDNSNSEFIMFLDSDDWYDKNACEKVFNMFSKTCDDIVCFGYNEIDKNNVLHATINHIKKLNNKNVSKKVIIKNQVFVWDKAFKKEFVTQCNVRFVEGLKCAEDLVFCLSLYYQKPKYGYIEEPLYYYRRFRIGNATSNNVNAIRNDYTSFKALVNTDLFKQQTLEIKKLTINHFISGSISYYRKFQNSNNEEKILKDIKDLVEFTEGVITPFQCYSLKNYRKLKKILWKSHKHWYFNIFNINTYPEYKDYIIFGHKITVNRSNVNA